MESVSRRRALTLLGVTVLGTRTLRSSRASESPDSPTERTDQTTDSRGQSSGGELFGTVLLGENQVPPVETGATGVALFWLPADATEVEYWLFVSEIEGAREAHIHKGPPDLNGNVVAYLFGPVEEPVSTTGLLSSGTLRADDLIWPLTDVLSLHAEMEAENVYVNVHTTDHPGGEIRGQIRPLGDGKITRPKSLYRTDAEETM